MSYIAFWRSGDSVKLFLFGDNILAKVLYIWVWEEFDMTDDYKYDY